jgi:hypothetical protein
MAVQLSPGRPKVVCALKSGDSASKADIDIPVEALKALKVKAGVAARRLKQALGVGAGGANGASGAPAAPFPMSTSPTRVGAMVHSPPSPALRLGKATVSPTSGASGAPAVGQERRWRSRSRE